MRPTDVDGETLAFLKKHPEYNASVTFSFGQKLFYAACLILAAVFFCYRWDHFIFLISILMMAIYFGSLLLRGGAAVFSFFGCGERRVTEEELKSLPDADLPVYTILLPVFHEGNIVAKLIRNVLSLDYPQDKLDVKLLLESGDDETRHALEACQLPDCCEILTMPPLPPQTKPRACNHGLRAARGEFCVIYDAEDQPERDQLKKAVILFRRDKAGKYICFQAKLNYFNYKTNLLTRLFTIEYSSYFDLTLSGYSLFHLPLPLGGTSNHFRTDKLREVGPWDPFNVTEDCDLGLRIYEAHYRTALMNSTTYEEANCQYGNWMRQRSRWVKGFLQTHLVHYRYWTDAVQKLGFFGSFGGFLAVGGSALMMLANVIFWAVLLFYGVLLAHGFCHGLGLWEQIAGPHAPGNYNGIFLFGTSVRAWPLCYFGPSEDAVLSHFSQIFFVLALILLAANAIFIGIGTASCFKRRYYDLVPYSLLMPFYWVLISLGAWKGFIQLFTKPFYWEKTRHGLDKSDER